MGIYATAHKWWKIDLEAEVGDGMGILKNDSQPGQVGKIPGGGMNPTKAKGPYLTLR
jgi:hypothetical protein